jgi:hypothetical protein
MAQPSNVEGLEAFNQAPKREQVLVCTAEVTACQQVAAPCHAMAANAAAPGALQPCSQQRSRPMVGYHMVAKGTVKLQREVYAA